MNEQISNVDFEAIKAECTAIKSVNIQEVIGGFIVNGAIEYRQGVNTLAVQRDVATASDAWKAADYARRYLDYGTFDREPTLFERMVDASGQRMADERQNPDKDVG